MSQLIKSVFLAASIAIPTLASAETCHKYDNDHRFLTRFLDGTETQSLLSEQDYDQLRRSSYGSESYFNLYSLSTRRGISVITDLVATDPDYYLQTALDSMHCFLNDSKQDLGSNNFARLLRYQLREAMLDILLEHEGNADDFEAVISTAAFDSPHNFWGDETFKRVWMRLHANTVTDDIPEATRNNLLTALERFQRKYPDYDRNHRIPQATQLYASLNLTNDTP